MRAAALLVLSLIVSAQAQNWTQFRGQSAAGIADGSNPHVRWDGEKNTNLSWKTPIPGLGHSSPVVWGDRVFVTTAISSASQSEFVHGLTDTGESANDTSKHSFHVYCLDKKTGRILWDRTARDVLRVFKSASESRVMPEILAGAVGV